MFTLQADDDTPPSQVVFNAICHAAGVKPDKARLAMPDWVDKHLDWVQQVTKPFLERICLSFRKFHEQWLHPSFPLNSAGILIMSRAYKLHTAVFFNDRYWTTSSEVSGLPKCSVFLVYRGGTVFQDTRRMQVMEYQDRRAMFKKLDKYFAKLDDNSALDNFHGRAFKSKLRNCIPSDDEADVEKASHNKKTDLVSNIMPTDDELDENEDVPPTPLKLPPCSECAKINKKKRSVSDCKKCSKCVQKEKKQKEKPTEDLDLEDILNDTVEKDNIMPTNETETAIKDVQTNEKETEKESGKNEVKTNETETEITEVKTNATETGKTEFSVKDTDTEKNQVKTNIMETEAKENIMLQPVVKLVAIASTSGQSTDRKSPVKSESSEEDDDTSSGSSEDEPEQEPPKKKRKLSEIGELIKKVKVDKHGRFKCLTRACYRDYGTKRALHRHLQNNHSGKKRYHCLNKNADNTDCLKHYSSQQLLNQHIQGEHGPGFEAYCGEFFKWPHDRRFHQEECDDCAKYM